jgi:hypothetical protein
VTQFDVVAARARADPSVDEGGLRLAVPGFDAPMTQALVERNLMHR